MQFTVNIIEQVTETRSYEINAASSRQAAKTARSLWLDGGQDSEAKRLEVKERGFEVFKKRGNSLSFLASFEDDDLETPNE